VPVLGGGVYAGHILACAKNGRAVRPTIFNARNFLAVDVGGIEIYFRTGI
jgi:hypothetical protein